MAASRTVRRENESQYNDGVLNCETGECSQENDGFSSCQTREWESQETVTSDGFSN